MKLSMFGAATALLILAGCGSNNSYKPVPPKSVVASVKPGDEATLFPLAVGNKWQYSVTTTTSTPQGSGSAPADITMEVKSIDKRADGSVAATIDLSKGEVLQDSQVWVVSPKGIFQETVGLAPDTRKFEPPQPVAYFPIEVDKEMTWEGKGPTGISEKGKNVILPIKQTMVSKGVESDVDTFMGTMSAYRFESTQTYSNGKVTVTDKSYTWWAPKIGMVRYMKELTTDKNVAQKQVISLRQYTVN